MQEKMLFSLLKRWTVAGSILFSFSVDCRCFLRELSPVFKAILPVASTPWNASPGMGG